MNICMVGVGAFASKHIHALRCIEDAHVVSVVGREINTTRAFAQAHNIPHSTTHYAEALTLKQVDAIILATPTQLHAQQAIQAMDAGKHVLVEIPMADNLSDAKAIVHKQKETGLVAMAGHTRRFNPSHQWIHNKIQAGELTLQQLNVQTYFFRRTNTNALGNPRSWTDHLLWHHACHTVDLFQYQCGETASTVHGVQGPINSELGIAMDMGISLKVPSGAICTLSLSFNNEGPFGSFFRYICDQGTYIARYDDLLDGNDTPIDLSHVAVSTNGIELCDREFLTAIAEAREPNASVAQCLPAMHTLHELEKIMGT